MTGPLIARRVGILALLSVLAFGALAWWLGVRSTPKVHDHPLDYPELFAESVAVVVRKNSRTTGPATWRPNRGIGFQPVVRAIVTD